MAEPEMGLPVLPNFELYSLYALIEDSFLIEDCPELENEDFCWPDELAWLEDAAPMAPAPAAAPAALDQDPCPLGLELEAPLEGSEAPDELEPLGGGVLGADCEELDQPPDEPDAPDAPDALDEPDELGWLDEPDEPDPLDEDLDCDELDQPELDPELLLLELLLLELDEERLPLENELLAKASLVIPDTPDRTSVAVSNAQHARVANQPKKLRDGMESP